MSHRVTISRLPDAHSDDYGYTFGGTHGNDCQVFRRCARASCQRMDPHSYAGDERVRHGKEHLYRDGEWLAESDTCGLSFAFESRGDDETFGGIPLGTYPVIVCWEDDDWWVEVQYSGPHVS